MTNKLVIGENVPLTMSFQEISQLTGKRHYHVLRDIKNLLNDLYNFKDNPNLDHNQIQGITIERDARSYIILIRLDKDHTLTLLTGYDAKARFRVIKRWQEHRA